MSDLSTTREEGEYRSRWHLDRAPGLLLCFAVAFLLALSRRGEPWYPYGEDGTIFYQQAIESGFRSIFLPYGGYLHVGLRILALVLGLFPPSLMPFAMVTTALAIQAGIATFIFSDRISNLVPSQFYRGLFAFVYIGLPDIDEVYGHFVNSQWHLALLSGLLVFGVIPSTRTGKIVRLVLVAILSLTGPFVAFLLPLGAYKLYRSRSRYNLGLLLCMVPSFVQICIVFLSGRATHPWQDILRPMVFPRAFGGRSLLGAAINLRLYDDHYVDGPLLWAATFAVLVLSIYAIQKRHRFAALMIYMGTCILLTSFRSGIGNIGARLDPAHSNRYYFILGFGLLTTLIFIVASENRYVRVATACCVVALLALSWRLPYPVGFWSRYRVALQAYDVAKPGTVVVFPESPRDWSYSLRKR